MLLPLVVWTKHHSGSFLIGSQIYSSLLFIVFCRPRLSWPFLRLFLAKRSRDQTEHSQSTTDAKELVVLFHVACCLFLPARFGKVSRVYVFWTDCRIDWLNFKYSSCAAGIHNSQVCKASYKSPVSENIYGSIMPYKKSRNVPRPKSWTIMWMIHSFHTTKLGDLLQQNFQQTWICQAYSYL